MFEAAHYDGTGAGEASGDCSVLPTPEDAGTWEGRLIATGEQLFRVLNILGETVVCAEDGTRLRYGDYECPHCGADLEERLSHLAERLIEAARPDR